MLGDMQARYGHDRTNVLRVCVTGFLNHDVAARVDRGTYALLGFRSLGVLLDNGYTRCGIWSTPTATLSLHMSPARHADVIAHRFAHALAPQLATLDHFA